MIDAAASQLKMSQHVHSSGLQHLDQGRIDGQGYEAAVPVTSEEVRRARRRFAAGVTIITVRLDDEIHGMTATAVCNVSLTPPLLLVCVLKRAYTHALITAAGIFAVNVLHHDQRELADRFAGRSPGIPNRFQGVAHHPAATGAPILDDNLGYYDCRVVAAHDGGDHTIFLGRVEAAGQLGNGQPLIYHQGNYLALPPFAQADSRSAEATR